MATTARPLTPAEARILQLLQDYYGPSNNADAVFFTESDNAMIFVTDSNGVRGLLVNLTVVPIMQEMEGVLDADVFQKYLRP